MVTNGYLLNTSTDRSGLVVVFAAIGVCWSLTVLVARLVGSISRRRALGWEDGCIIASTATGIASSAAVFIAVKHGFGRRQSMQPEDDTIVIEKTLYAADMLYILALAFSKVAVLRLIIGLRPIDQHRYMCRGLEGFTALWAIAAVLAIAIRCNMPQPWTSMTLAHCPDLFIRWAALESISLVIETLIFGVAAAMIWMLHMPRKNKLGALIAFAIRLPVVIPTAYRIRYLNIAFHSDDFSLAAAGAIIAMQCNMHYSVMSASLSYLKPFLAAFDSNLGASTRLDTVVATRSSERRKTGTEGSSSSNLRSTDTAAPETTWQSKQAKAGGRHSSADSKAPIIMKTTSYQVAIEDE